MKIFFCIIVSGHIMNMLPIHFLLHLLYKIFFIVVGPCALDYTKMKTSDHFWTDPPADELVQRHRIHSGTTHHMTGGSPQSPKRLGLQVRGFNTDMGPENGYHNDPKFLDK